MALIETNFIRPQEVYDRNTGESKVRYRSYDGNDRFIPVVDGEKGVPKTMVEVTHAELKAMRDGGKLTAGALYRITDYNCTTTQENTQSAGHQFDIVLLALSENKLAEEGWAMEHPTDVYDVTFSDGVTKKCYLYGPFIDRDEEVYNIVDVDTLLGLSSVSKEAIIINEETKTATISNDSEINSTELTEENLPYNYFQNSNLSAWKVWYCLDNDTARFAWAQAAVVLVESIRLSYDNNNYIRDNSKDTIVENVSYYGWEKEGSDYRVYFTTNETPNTQDKIYTVGGPPHSPIVTETDILITQVNGTPAQEEGRGVIYRLVDEFNNDIKYDFKNIQFKRKITDGQYDANGTETWCYTLNVWYNNMCQDASIVGNTLQNDKGFITGVYDNIFGYATAYDLYIEGVNTFAFALSNNVVLSFDDGGYFGIHSNTIGNSFFANTIGNSFYDNTIGNSFFANTIGNNSVGNTIGNNFSNNTIGDNFSSNTIGNFCASKTISDNTSYANYGNNGVELATKS